ncbi:HNH endonuclease [Sorangium sp. So ce363]|uniref:HNH endonuclease n=1 Tax=Sorangium sp. So ce363 TaxID=3133304 RepID=UPI003F644E2D
MSTYVSELLRSRIEEADRRRCQYCLTSEANSGIPLTCDQITPVSKGGPTSFENVCLACRPCNEFKAGATESVDPLTGDVVPVFNPRLHRWSEHFTWSVDATRSERRAMEGTPPERHPASRGTGGERFPRERFC